MIVGTAKFEIFGANGRLEIQVKVDAAVSSLKAGNSGRMSMLCCGSRIPSLGNLKGDLCALKAFN